MSLKYAAQKIGANHYVLPKTKEMHVDAQAFLSDALYAASDEALWGQVARAASYPGVIGAYLMPDCHVGYGVPVGCVVVTSDTVIQGGSGYDISCGVLYMRVPGLHASDVADPKLRRQWIDEVELRVATGVGSKRPKLAPTLKRTEMDDILRFGAKAIGVSADKCERQYIDVPEDTDLGLVQKAYSKATPQLASVGGGNHFIEMQVDEQSGEVWVMVHCGSRGFGWQTANHFFYEGAKLRGLPAGKRDQSWLGMEEPLGKQYWAHHNAAANYAVANRHLIVQGIDEALEAVFKQRGEVYYEISHNLVQQETLLLPDGSTKRGFVHRKGATRAFPGGHPDLKGSVWEQTGHPCLIPGSMYHGAAILFAEPGATKSACSVNHGSGRLLARGRAKRELGPRQLEIDGEMRDVERVLGGVQIKGILGNTRRTPLDECAHVYKDLDEVLGVLEAEGIAKVAKRLYPVANIKGMD